MKKYIITATAVSALVFGVTLFAGDDERYESQSYTKVQTGSKTRAFTQLESIYKRECSSCHMAYQPKLLPKRSWTKMMNTLENHFNVDATLDPQEQRAIAIYLTSNAGDVKQSSKHFSRMSGSVADNKTPLRITQTPYFIKEHRKIPQRFIKQKEVKSFANCNACHTTAEKGIYSERAIKIPNYGRWKD